MVFSSFGKLPVAKRPTFLTYLFKEVYIETIIRNLKRYVFSATGKGALSVVAVLAVARITGRVVGLGALVALGFGYRGQRFGV